MLYIVATPIGNLDDITLRALEVLKKVDIIACEDTRQTKKILDRYQFQKSLTSYYEHNKLAKGDYLIKLLKEGKDIAVVSDSGTPGISDPGFHIAKLALEQGLQVTPIPGACALVAALSASGIPADRFIFQGFLPKKSGQRKKILTDLSQLDKTIVLYESPYKFIQLLSEIKEIFGEVEVAVNRELTKKFEEIKKDKISNLIAHFVSKKILGEFVLVIQR